MSERKESASGSSSPAAVAPTEMRTGALVFRVAAVAVQVSRVAACSERRKRRWL
jgi:hypothetical protein